MVAGCRSHFEGLLSSDDDDVCADVDVDVDFLWFSSGCILPFASPRNDDEAFDARLVSLLGARVCIQYAKSNIYCVFLCRSSFG